MYCLDSLLLTPFTTSWFDFRKDDCVCIVLSLLLFKIFRFFKEIKLREVSQLLFSTLIEFNQKTIYGLLQSVFLAGQNFFFACKIAQMASRKTKTTSNKVSVQYIIFNWFTTTLKAEATHFEKATHFPIANIIFYSILQARFTVLGQIHKFTSRSYKARS